MPRARATLLLAVLLVAAGLMLTRCPANRDGMAGRLAQAMQETTVSARSGALALDLWTRHRSTAELTSVQLGDARDQVVKAYKGIADLRADDPADLDRQRMLTESMTTVIAELNGARATVRAVTAQPTAQTARDQLAASAQALESRYR